MPIEYQGQTINSMKWNDQEILGGSSGGGVEIRIDDAYFPVKDSSSSTDRKYAKARIKYARFYDEEEGVYKTVLSFPDTLKVAGSWSSVHGDYDYIRVAASVSSSKYVIPEGFRPANYNNADKYIVTGDIAHNDYYQYIYLRSDYTMNCQGSSSGGETFYIKPDMHCTKCYVCDYTG